MIWKAAWAADHPEAVADRSIADLPLTRDRRRLHRREHIYRATKDCAECFGAMGVMRDMPLQKVHQRRPHLPLLRRRRRRRRSSVLPRRSATTAAPAMIAAEYRTTTMDFPQQRTALLADGRRANSPTRRSSRSRLLPSTKRPTRTAPSTGSIIDKGSKLGFRTLAVPKE